MSLIWCVFLLFSLLAALFLGRTQLLSGAILSGAEAGIRLTISLAGPLCLWSGLCKVMENIGATNALSRLLAPVLCRLFPNSWQDREVRENLCGNVSANLLGLGNAATPMGLRAVRRMKQLSGSQTATDEMCRLIVMNTASIQLIPTTAAAVRAGLGSSSPFDILPAVWLSSALALTAGLCSAWLLSKWLS